jgi:hypothetical protein
MKNLYFQRSNNEHLLIKENVADEKEALKEISAFLERHNCTSYYTRYWTEHEVTTFDVGSWSEFFKLASPEIITATGTEKDFIERV